MGALFENFTLYFTTMRLETYYMDLKKITGSWTMHTETKSVIFIRVHGEAGK